LQLIATVCSVDVAGDKLETRTLIPPGNCPGYYDVKPSDIVALANSTALFIHSFQANFPYITDLVEAADNPDLIIIAINEVVQKLNF
jgi:zinc transport system substrate-binding protein